MGSNFVARGVESAYMFGGHGSLASGGGGSHSLEDKFGRKFPYIRLSITDICNYRCSYCLPDGYNKCNGNTGFLSIDEISRLISAFADMGVNKVRITGGEPSIRKDCTDIIRNIASNKSINQIALTTNGYKMAQHVKRWRDAGLTHINVSVDSLNADKFYSITGHNRLYELLEGIDAAIAAGFEMVKVNAVLLRGINDSEIDDYLSWVKDAPISVRFIELMQTGDNTEYFNKYHVSASTVINRLEKAGWTRKVKSATNAGPAQEYIHPDYVGTIGIIAPYSKDFCRSCNRLRITATGDLRLCLFGNQGVSLRHLLQDDEQQPLLKQLIMEQLIYKCSSHFLAEGYTGCTPHLASIGG